MVDPFSIMGLGFTAVTVVSLLALHLRKVQVPRVGRWVVAPDVFLHPASPVDMHELRKVMDYWSDLGFTFGKTSLSHEEPSPGGIYVTIPSQDWINSAAGRAWWSVLEEPESESGEPPRSKLEDVAQITPQSGSITLARIVIDPGLSTPDRLTALRHEMGHALGFQHARTPIGKKNSRLIGRPTGHVMHPHLDKCGKGHRGIKIEKREEA